MLKKIISFVLSWTMITSQPIFAQGVAQINLGNYLRTVGSSVAMDKFRPLHMRYFSYNAVTDNFQLLLDKGDNKDIKEAELEEKTKVLMEYFKIGLALPNEKFWVNLRPDAQDQIIDPELEKTDMGRIMLEADLQLKKDTAGLTSPQNPEGKAYWDKLYKKAGELFGSENITIPTITRPWIVPGEIILRQGEDSAYIFKANMKVMLESDYLVSRGGSRTAPTYQQYAFTDPRMKELNEYSSQLIRELIIPRLTKEVNTSKRYAALRQVFFSLVMARWFKDTFGSSGSNRAPGIRAPENSYVKLIDSGDLANLTSKEAWSKTYYFNEYKKSFEKGEYNLKEQIYTPTGQVIRSYVSGGILNLAGKNTGAIKSDNPIVPTIPSAQTTVIAHPGGPIEVINEIQGKGGLALKTDGDRKKSSSSVVKSEVEMQKEVQDFKKEIITMAMENKLLLGDEIEKDIQAGNIAEIIKKIVKYTDESITLIEKWRVLNEALEKRKNTATISYVIRDLYSSYEKNEISADEAVRGIFKQMVVDIQNKDESRKKIDSDQELYQLVEAASQKDGSLFYPLLQMAGRKGGLRGATFATLNGLGVFLRRVFLVSLEIYKEKLENTRDVDVSNYLRDGEIVLAVKARIYANKQSGDEYGEKVIKAMTMDLKDIRMIESLIPFLPLPERPIISTIKVGEIQNMLKKISISVDLSKMNEPELSQYVTDVRMRLERDKINNLKVINNYWVPKEEKDSLQIEYFSAIEHLKLWESWLLPAEKAKTSSGIIKEINPGGIDFRTMNYLVEPMGSFKDLRFMLPTLTSNALERIDLDKELESLRDMVKAGMVPSGMRVKEYLAACFQKGKIEEKQDDLLVCLAEIYRLAEEENLETSPELRESLVIVDTGKFVLLPNNQRVGLN